MGRFTDLRHPSPYRHDGAAPNIKALFIYVRTSVLEFNDPLPQFLTIVLNPPNHFISLHRLLNHPLPHAIFAAKLSLCSWRRRPSEPLSFQLFLGEAMLLNGALIEQDQNFSFQLFLGEAMLLNGALIEQDQNRWTLDCKSQPHLLQPHYSPPISEIQLCFAFDDGNLAATNWVRLVNPKLRVKNCVNFGHLEQIPEEMELPSEDSHEVVELERLRRTIDLGIWVLCLGLGVGYLVSRASVQKFRPYLNL